MHQRMTRVAVAVAAAAALSTLGFTAASASGTATQTPRAAKGASWRTTHAAAVAGAQLWVRRYNGSGEMDTAVSVAVSPDGGRVFVTGDSGGAYATVAYNAATGAGLWVKRYGNGYAYEVAVSPGGSTFFVTGQSQGATSGWDYATVAYNAATGAQLWARRYNGPGNDRDAAYAIAVSPGGGTVFVTGESTGTTSGYDYATVAYNAATGAQLWARRYTGPGSDRDAAHSVAVSPNGSEVFVTGAVGYGGSSGWDYTTVAYSAATGTRLWARRYTGPGNSTDQATSVAVSTGGGTVFVTGFSTSPTSDYDYATVAYNAATGAQLWARRYNGPGNSYDQAYSLAVSPGGHTVFVTGAGDGVPTDSGYIVRENYLTVAYNAATGAQLWARRYNGPANRNDSASSVAVSPGGGTVFVTGDSYGTTSETDYATVAYSATTGAQLWVRRYNGPGNSSDDALSVAVSPTGGRVFVTGFSYGGSTALYDYATIAYSG